MKKIVVGLIILYICISYPIILVISAMGLGIWCIGIAFLNSAAKTLEPMEKSEENPIKEEKDPESYTREGKPGPDVPTPAGPIKVDPDEVDAKQAIPVDSYSIKSETD